MGVNQSGRGVPRPYLMLFLMWMAYVLAACGTASPSVSYLALLAPFEGRYREVGYDLLYAARLGLADAEITNLELLPVDDGGSVQDAVERARAMALNPDVRAVLVGGLAATSPEVLAAFDNLPVVVIGQWNAERIDDNTFILANETLSDRFEPSTITSIEAAAAIANTPIIGGELFGLKQFPKLREDLNDIVVITSTVPSDTVFTERFLGSDAFVPEPGLLVTLAYDAARLTATAVGDDQPSRRVMRDRLTATDYSGLSGIIRFENGYWADAPIFEYTYNSEGRLEPVSDE